MKISQKLIYSLRFLNKGFVHSLWNDLLTSNAVVARSRNTEEKSAHTTDLLAILETIQWNLSIIWTPLRTISGVHFMEVSSFQGLVNMQIQHLGPQ